MNEISKKIVEEKTFKVEKLSFQDRLKKNLLLKILALIILGLLPVLFDEKLKNNWIAYAFPLFILAVITTLTIIEAKKYVYEVKLTSNEIEFFGNNFNTEWNQKFEIQNVNIQIIEHKSRGGTVVGYTIVFKSNSKKIILNKLYNWNNYILYKLFTEFKNNKGEKIIIDENSLLNGIKQKAEYEFEWEN